MLILYCFSAVLALTRYASKLGEENGFQLCPLWTIIRHDFRLFIKRYKMNIQSPFSNGIQGYQRAADSVFDASLNISRANINALSNESSTPAAVNPDQFVDASKKTVTDSLIQLKVAELHAGANAKSIQTADDMLGTLIDIRV